MPLSQPRGDASPTRSHRRACHLCEAICGLEIQTRDGEVVSIKGDSGDPLSRGHICPKAIALKDLHEDPDRLRQPVKRVAGKNGAAHWETISWEEALDTTAERLLVTVKQHGMNALGIYLGNPTVHNYGMMTHQGQLFRFFRTDNRFSATSVDQLPHHLVALWLFGHKLLLPIPDIDRSDYFLMLGANPVASNGSIWTVPDIRQRMGDFKRRGGRLVVVDPRRTETAKQASEHLYITPGTDALLLCAVLHTLFNEDLVDLAHLTPFVTGLEPVAEALAPFSPEFAAEHCGIDAATMRRLARELAAAPAAICYGRMGVSTQRFGALCQWLIQLINIATGNLDRPGGSLFTLPAVDQVENVGRGGFARHHSRVRQLPEFDRELPASTLAEEITTPGETRIRALFTGAGNPVLSTPNGRQLDAALAQLDFMVSLDPYINETTRHADIILPPTSPLEHDHYDLAFHVNAMRNTARFNEAVFDKPEGALHDWEIFQGLAERVGAALGQDVAAAMSPAAIIDLGLQGGPYSAARGHPAALSLQKLRETPSGVDLGPLEPQLPGRLRTADGMIHCATPEPLADLLRLHEEFDQPAAPALRLIGRRHLRSNNSWMHNFHRLVKGPGRCTLLMHPRDMTQRRLTDGATAILASRAGSIRVDIEASEDIMPGVVSLPHGYGHHRDGVRLEIASSHAGVSCNDVTDELALDTLSGNAAVNGLVVSVEPA